ncbi:MAG TPA: hypothetical protein VH394_26250 [Thermoanaerobaculia bacterium]|jgi:hypothetical protein|nr:hypothetical protein [Thermoanaerobaculia bacterium]
MGLKEVLSKMKIVEIEPEDVPGLQMPPSAPATPPMPTLKAGMPPGMPPGQPTDIRDLLGSLQPPPEIDEKKLAEIAPPDDAEEGGPGIPDFAAIYKAAKIEDPAHGYTAQKVLEILSSPHLANLDSKAKAAALAGFLQMNPTGPVPITDVVQDAVRRDQALDKFEDFLRTKLKARTEQMEKENARLQAEIDDLVRRNREKMDANRRDLEKEEARLSQWQLSKKAEERRLFDAVSPFVEANPITTGEAPAVSPAPAPAPEQA